MNLILRKIQNNDLEMIMNWRMKPEITSNLYTDPRLTIEMQYEWYKKICNDNSVKYWIIEYETKAIGLIWLYNIDYNNRKCEWGYFIGEDSCRGKGLGRTLECNIYDYVFSTLGLNRLYCEVFAFNESVVKIHEKFGSEIEGVLKQNIYKNGNFYDVVCMAILAEKWTRIKNEYEYEKISIE